MVKNKSIPQRVTKYYTKEHKGRKSKKSTFPIAFRITPPLYQFDNAEHNIDYPVNKANGKE